MKDSFRQRDSSALHHEFEALEQQVKRLIQVEQELHQAQLRLDEQARLYRDLHAVSGRLFACDDMVDVSLVMSQAAVTTLGYERSVFLWLDDDERTLRPVACEGYFSADLEELVASSFIDSELPCFATISDGLSDHCAGTGGVVGGALLVDEWFLVPLGSGWPAHSGAIVVGVRKERKGYHPPLCGEDERVVALRSLAKQAGAAIELCSERRALAERVDERTRELAAARDAAEKANAAKSEFLAVMSHEMRTPLNAVLGFANLLEVSSLDDEQQDYTNTIKGSSEALLTLVNEILDFTRIEAGQIEFNSQPYAIRELLDSIVDKLSSKARAKGLVLAVVVDRSVPALLIGDVERMSQILETIVNNAIRFTSEGTVCVRVFVEHQQLRFDVIDTGCGIALKDQERVFEVFTQGDMSHSRNHGGLGLGLSIARALVRLLGGTISLRSREGTGTTVSVQLPLLVGPKDEAQCLRWQNCRVYLDLAGGIVRESLFEYLKFAGCQIVDEVPAELVITDREGKTGQDGYLFIGRERPPVSWHRLREHLHEVSKQIKNCDASSKPSPAKASCEVASDSRILIVEDDEVNREMLVRLVEILGHDADAAGDGAEALERMLTKRYDLVFMDIHMPTMSGIEATKRYRAQVDNGSHIVALSADVRLDLKEDCIACGMNGFMGKPVDMTTLRQVLDSPIALKRV